LRDRVIFSSYDGFTYALDVNNGTIFWKTFTGSSATAPLIDNLKDSVFVASTNGNLTALSGSKGSIIWTYQSTAAILTSPSLSEDGKQVFAGNEAVQVFAVDSSSGALQWITTLQGQSLSDRYPVVAGNTVTYRSQPL
jgi:outer membrane protein assembly factor BamB